MMDGDIDGAMAALFSKTELSFEKFMTDGKFNAGAFNADFEMEGNLDAGRIIGEYMSANAPKLQNAGGVGGSTRNRFHRKRVPRCGAKSPGARRCRQRKSHRAAVRCHRLGSQFATHGSVQPEGSGVIGSLRSGKL